MKVPEARRPSDDRRAGAAELWTVTEVAAYLRVPVKTIYVWRGKGYGPPARRMGKHLRYRPADVVAWAETSVETSAETVG
jgi:excisionase family DNA binding protein